MKIKFERDKNGFIIAVDKNGNKVGNVFTMGDMVKKESTDKK